MTSARLFTPRYIKQGRQLLRGVDKFVHFKRDVLKPEKLEEIGRLRAEFAEALRRRERERAETLAGKLTEACDRASPPSADSGIREWVDSLVTCAVIVFAIRAYFLQPFKIPTGSMQPTLNGVIAAPTDPQEGKPNVLRQAWELVLRGRNYVKVEAPLDGYLVSGSQRSVGVFLNYTTLNFESRDGRRESLTVWAPARQLIGQWRPAGEGASSPGIFDGLWLRQEQNPALITVNENGAIALRAPIPVRKGQVLASGMIDSGDLVLVDKVSYHFREPRRGEVFVFTTRGIAGIENRLDPREGSQHYIKRLTGLPGDHLLLKDHALYINGEPAREKGIRRVIDQRDPDLGTNAYHGYSSRSGNEWEVPAEPPGYFAMGDNSYNSYDSRDWGAVPEDNLVGPALFSLWPITSGHWGLIR